MELSLDRINRAEEADAEAMFRECCGSTRWARLMTLARPFGSEIELTYTASAIWRDLRDADWLEAFSAHPKIGETRSAETRSADWSAGEQSGMDSADELVKQQLADANREYYDKFGFIFIVCATGKSADEMLRICRTRLANGPETEIHNAAREQQEITEIRLRKLLAL
jgi:2-oxo-4-hydroxy-4-carboxy-5-ureidoimidazoline decarboxylase